MEEVVFVQQNSFGECVIKCSNNVKSIKVHFENTRIENLVVELKEQ